MSTPNDLQALLASIRPRPSPSSTQGQDTVAQHPLQYQQHGYRPHPQYQQPYDGQSLPHPHLHHDYRQPSVSSAIHSPSPVNNTPPHHGSDIMSPNVPTPRGGEMFPPHPQTQPQPQNADRSVNLLNLLKFNQSAAAPAQQQGPPMGMEQPRQPQTYNGPNASSHHGRNISASDLVASLFGRQGPGAAPAGSADFTPAAGEPIGAAESSASPVPTPENTQEMLLRLLNRSKPGQETTENLMKPIYQSSASASPMPEAESSTFVAPTVEAIEESLTSRPEEVIPGKPDVYVPQPSGPSSGSKESLFTYVNPFDQLAAASPRNKTPQPKSGSESPAMETARSKHISAATHAQPTAVSAEDERAKSPSLSEEQKEAVSQVVGNLVSQITRDVDETVAKSTKEEKKPAVAMAPPDDTQDVLSSIASHLKETAADAKEEAEEEKLKETMKNIPATTAGPAAAKEAFNIGSGDGLVDSWESAEDSAEKDEERVVAVHNFPLKPFISISVKSPSGKLVSLRDDGIMDIARLKKEFDQLDRSLTSATSEYIVYALAKNGGMRIIRQDDGRDKQVFRSTRDRVFNVAVCTSQTTHGASEEQAVLGIGVSGAVYWALISRAEKDLFELDALESESLIFPPFPASDENTSGGQLKTRAKRSSRHPGFFAIGRGKNIYVISPQAAADAAYGVSGTQRTVNTEKFFKERALKISTGKAGKDFIFSDDDTVIASLDKTGRLRFWDVRELVSNSTFLSNGFTPVEIRVPLSTFVTGSPTEKSWPTSVLFIDKLRPYVKSLALRYVLVGLKQNHTLQLWDIGLGKAVQELKFPHENESDAICSVAYHPASGIAVIGHPTRNSIYFVHLSAPRYNLQPMSQASFIKRASEKDNTLPKPESTACLSGIREISFASKGQLRSLDILPKAANEENELFELYVMHSRGVTCLTIKKEDLGWSTDNKIVRPVNALEQGLIEISELQAFPSYFNDEPSVNGDSASTSKSVPKEIAKKPESAEAAASAATGAMASTPRTQSPTKPILKKKDEQAESVSTTNGSDKADKKKKKKGGISEGAAKLRETATPSFTGSAEAATSPQVTGEQFNGHNAFKSTPPTMDSQTAILGAGPSDPNAWFEHMRNLQNGVSTEFNKSLGREIEGLYRRFDEERRNWDSASAAKQDQVLRLVSSTLSDNVEKNLARIVSNSIQSEVLPSLSDLTSTAVGKQLNTLVAQQMGNILPRELQQALPEAIGRALKRPDVMKTLTDAIGQKVTSHIEGEMSKAVHTTLSPVMQSLRSLEKSSVDMEKKYETQRREYVSKIEQLTSLVHGLADNVSSMTAAQSGFQDEILKLNRALANRGTRSSTPQSSSKSTAPQIPTERPNPTSRPQQPSAPVPSDSRSIDDAELTEVAQLMSHGRFEEGSVKWLQSSQQADLFDNLFVRLNPSYLTGLSPIVALSVGVAVTSSLETNVAQRLAWLEVVFQTVNPQDPDIREVAPQIMEILLQRLNGLYMTVAQNSPHDQVLPKISVLARYARQLRG